MMTIPPEDAVAYADAAMESASASAAQGASPAILRLEIPTTLALDHTCTPNSTTSSSSTSTIPATGAATMTATSATTEYSESALGSSLSSLLVSPLMALASLASLFYTRRPDSAVEPPNTIAPSGEDDSSSSPTHTNTTSTGVSGAINKSERAGTTPPWPQLRGRNKSPYEILWRELVIMLQPGMPAMPRIAENWRLIYSINQHGGLLKTLYRNTMEVIESLLVDPRGLILIIRDHQRAIFGAFLSDAPTMAVTQKFFGSGETFLFQIPEGSSVPNRYDATTANSYYIYCDPQFLAIGSSDGHYALYLDQTFENCTSQPTTTFGNSCLASSERFSCLNLELWGYHF